MKWLTKDYSPKYTTAHCSSIWKKKIKPPNNPIKKMGERSKFSKEDILITNTHTYIMEYYSAINKNKIMLFVAI